MALQSCKFEAQSYHSLTCHFSIDRLQQLPLASCEDIVQSYLPARFNPFRPALCDCCSNIRMFNSTRAAATMFKQILQAILDRSATAYYRPIRNLYCGSVLFRDVDALQVRTKVTLLVFIFEGRPIKSKPSLVLAFALHDMPFQAPSRIFRLKITP